MPASDNALRTHPMIGLPSGLERVRWNESASSPQPARTPRIFAPRAVAASRLSSTSAPAPSAITNPSRFFANGRTAACGGSLWVDSAESNENRSRKIAFAPERGLRDGFLCGDIGKSLGKVGRRKRFDRNEVHRSSHGRFEALGRKTGNCPDAGLARRELLPIICFSGTKRGHDTHAGNDDDRPAELIAWCCHVSPALGAVLT